MNVLKKPHIRHRFISSVLLLLALCIQTITMQASPAHGHVRSLLVSFNAAERGALKLQVSPAIGTVADCYAVVRERVAKVQDKFTLEYYNSITSAFEPLIPSQSGESPPLPAASAGRLRIVVVEPAEASTLCIEGRAFDIPNGQLPFMGRHLTIGDISGEQNAADGATGRNTWDASVVLTAYLAAHPTHIAAKSVLEVGSGTGLVGIACAALGAKATMLTDLSYTVGNMQENIQKNMDMLTEADIDVRELDWTRQETYLTDTTWDVLVAADVVWLEHLVPPLLEVLDAHTGPETVIFLSHQHRSATCDALLLDGLQARFTCEVVKPHELHDVYQSNKIDVYRCIRRGAHAGL